MASSQYHLVTQWKVVGTVEEVSEILERPEDLARWWPAVYREAEMLAPGDSHGVGRSARVVTKGYLPYTLSWQLRVVDSRHPHGFTIEATGDFVGRGVWTFQQAGAWVDVTFDWQVSVEKPGVKELSPLLKPVFVANHRWAMRRGEESLRLELERRRAAADKGLRLSAPPLPTTASPWPLLLGGAGVVFLLVALAAVLVASRRRARRRR